ncbi:MAG TPA: glutamate--tRNA ligase, partial [Acidimicrobiales bacterium]|nr:glutamate--tRNA ligase [Acidimicrobiales bacterium]
EYLRAMPTSEMVERAAAWQRARWEPIAPLVQERARTLAEVYAMTDFLYLPEPVIDQKEWDTAVAKQPAFAAILTAALSKYAEIDWTAEEIHQATLGAGEAAGVAKPAQAQAPIRLAVTGRSVGPPLWESLALLGRDRTRERITSALRRLGVDA